MTKRMIDFDVLMKCVNSLYTRCRVPNKGEYSLFLISKKPELSNIFMNCLDVLVREIQELATPAPEPQESIFDAEGDWCYDLTTVSNKIMTLLLVNKKDDSQHVFKNCIYTDNSVLEDAPRAYGIIKTNNTIEPLECRIKEKLQIDEVDYQYIKILAYKMPTLPKEV